MTSKKVQDFVAFQIVQFIARIVYVAALALVIPLIPLVFSPLELVNARKILGIALFLVFVSFLIVFAFTNSKRKSLEALAYMTLIPGVLAIIFTLAGERRLLEFFATFGNASPVIQEYLASYVPTGWVIAGIYIILGGIFLFVSKKVRN